MTAPEIKTFQRVIPMIYAYNTPGIEYHNGWTKIGYTEKQTVEDRINQQTHTAGIRWTLAWKNNAMYSDGSGEYFTDKPFHDYLEHQKEVKREKNTEWFYIDGKTSKQYFHEFADRESIYEDHGVEYTLRDEQATAVRQTSKYFKYQNGKEFLWNAKPRFGKTLTSYDLIQTLGYKKVLIVTNRPSIANSWADDFTKFVGWKQKYSFVSDTDALRNKKGVMSYAAYRNSLPKYGENKEAKGLIAFESLQGLKGSIYFGGEFNKLKWIHDTEFNLLIVDESQEGVDTIRTERAFKNIKTDHILYLSGTPFKQLASDQFADNQIFNWSYADEQDAKVRWVGDEFNPYESLPKLNMFTYELSNMIYDEIKSGANITEEYTVDFAFDLNEFFLTNDRGKLIHEKEIIKFLHALSTQEKYPYSTPKLRKELSHTLWLFNRVNSAKAVASLLKKDPVFKEYKIILAAGDGKLDDDTNNEKAFDRVKNAIKEYDKTITLSVGQLTVGVTIPEWSGVLMLCNMQSPSSYMQAAFRAQNPCWYSENGKRYRKENAYVFDFDPARTLIIFDEFANNLSKNTVDGRGTTEDREKNIRRLLNFFPVIGEDSEGRMVELDAKSVLSIPRKLKSQEVVRHGFISNFLFQNIGNIFSAPVAIKQIIEKLTPAKEDKSKTKGNVKDIVDVPVDKDGNVDLSEEIVIGKSKDVFGPKIYEELKDSIEPDLAALENNTQDSTLDENLNQFIDKVKEEIKQRVFEPTAETYQIKKSALKQIERELDTELNKKLNTIKDDYKQQINIAKADHKIQTNNAETEQDLKKADQAFNEETSEALRSLIDSVHIEMQKTIDEKPTEVIRKFEEQRIEEKKRSIEESVRDHLRGFSRTIPSFIMAYGDENLTLSNFDDYTEDDVFEEVTGITEEQFRFLRDGGLYFNEETGKEEYFYGHLFDEVVFNDSIKEFLRKKEELNNYFDESLKEDIFDYIPPQKTNQIYTPKWVVKKMVDMLEEENPGCFDDPTKTFADLYMKSGLYITEIVKRLYQSKKMKQIIPDDTERIHHIINEQVYGMAPTRIIYLIATNYILGFDKTLKGQTKNFVQADAAEAAKNGTLQDLVDNCFENKD